MKKSLMKAFVTVLALGTLTACGGKATSDVTSSAKAGGKDSKGMDVYTYDNVITGHTTEFHKLTADYKKASSKPGTVERVDYTTTVYGEVSYEKHFNVYLPYGYNKNDTSKKYNVIYFQHGDKRSADVICNTTEETEQKRMLDNMFDPAMGGIDPAIIVFPTLYNAYNETNADLSEAGDRNMTVTRDGKEIEVPANLDQEYITDILPLVESKYNTYTENATTAEGLIAARKHRAFTGYSRGCIFTWKMFQKHYEYFQWWAPMSCMCYDATGSNFNPGSFSSGEEAWEKAYQGVKSARDAFKAYPFFIYASVGNKNDMPQMREEMNYWVNHKDSIFNFGTDPEENNFYFSVSKFEHSDIYLPYYYYNSLQVLFK
jgi:enterochelin esterase-like enzyme/predicted small lipoprotein YifL